MLSLVFIARSRLLCARPLTLVEVLFCQLRVIRHFVCVSLHVFASATLSLRCGYFSGRVLMSLFFFFKQKTAYEMRISDWSSDVCSSDLSRPAPALAAARRLYGRHARHAVRDGLLGTS